MLITGVYAIIAIQGRDSMLYSDIKLKKIKKKLFKIDDGIYSTKEI